MQFEIRPAGQCLGSHRESQIMTVGIGALIESGDLVRVTFIGKQTPVVKQLDCTHDGSWFLCCLDSTIPISHYIFPQTISKVVATRDSGEPLPILRVPQVEMADEATFKLLDEASRAARLEWSTMGRPRGVPFPGLSAMRAHLERIAPSKCPTFPMKTPLKQPVQLSQITTIGGTIESGHTGMLQFNLGEPLIRPAGTQYQILRSVSTLANPTSTSVTTVIWQGVASEVSLPADARSMYWYHGRAIANSYTSQLTANTFGLGARPWIPPESVPGNRAFPDGEFAFASNSYWTWVDSGAAVGVPSSRAFFPGSGFTTQRGYMRLTISSHNNGIGQTYVMPARFDVNSRFATNAAPMLPGQRGSSYFSVRGTGSSTLPNIMLGVYGCRVESPGTLPQLSLLTLSNTTVDIRSIGSGTWVTYLSTFTMANSFYDGAVMAITLPPAYGGPAATIDIGAAQLTTF